MPDEAQASYYRWLNFLADPGTVSTQTSFMLNQNTMAGRSGRCTVEGCKLVEATGVAQANHVTVVATCTPGTQVSALNVKPGGNGASYWFPYLDRAVGEVDISYHAPVGTVALTAGMNGCSLRIYANARLGVLKFCHDNNGLYARDDGYAQKGFLHVLSVNADARERGVDAHGNALHGRNVNNYWQPNFDSPGSGVFFISIKTGADRWSVYQTVANCQSYQNINISGGWFGHDSSQLTLTFAGAQADNRLTTTFDQPARVLNAPLRMRTTDDLLVPAPAPRARSASF